MLNYRQFWLNICRLIVCDGHLALENLLKGDESFRTGQTESLDLVLEQVEQVVVVSGVELDENVVLAGSEMESV